MSFPTSRGSKLKFSSTSSDCLWTVPCTPCCDLKFSHISFQSLGLNFLFSPILGLRELQLKIVCFFKAKDSTR